MSFDGMRVIALESRRAAEIAQLIRTHGGDPFVAPSMREVPLEHNEQAFAFAERLFAGEFDMMIFLTGVGTRALASVLASRFGADRFPEALRRLTTVTRGPKPIAALRNMNVPIGIAVPEPNTWREILAVTRDRPERRIAVQEYGRSNPDLLDGLRARAADVTAVQVYQWDLPVDLEPLREAALRIASAKADVILFTTSVQVEHLMRVAEDLGLRPTVEQGLRRMLVASVGPTTTEALDDFGIQPDLEPSHPKMGFLVKETAERAHQIVARKRVG
jgi:uroporphyrinogen-III synthase